MSLESGFHHELDNIPDGILAPYHLSTTHFTCHASLFHYPYANLFGEIPDNRNAVIKNGPRARGRLS